MPELPEVETARRFAHEALTGRRIKTVRIEKDELVFDNASPAKMKKALAGRRVVDTHRRGKHLWFELDQRPWPYFHFAMTGAFHLYEEVDERPRFLKIELLLDSGHRFAMTNKRRLGRIRIFEDPATSPPIVRLGFDPFLDMPSEKVFCERLGKRAAPVKAVLLDQTFAAGVGNWIADEILYQAGIDPRRRANALSPAELKAVRTAMHRIITKAVAVSADADLFPKSWLFHHRWGKAQGAKTGKGEILEFITVGGRTTAWAPQKQQ